MIDISFKMFFDRAIVKEKVGKAKINILSKIGSFIRIDAKRSIRKTKKSAEPGNPPRSHSGTLRDLIFFGYDAPNDSVVIGPKLAAKPRGVMTTPQVLEEGGIVKGVKYPSFAYMAPARDRNMNKFRELIANSVR